MSALSDADVSELQQKLDAEVEANLGMAMIYNLITTAQEWVDEKVLRKAGGYGRGLAMGRGWLAGWVQWISANHSDRRASHFATQADSGSSCTIPTHSTSNQPTPSC